MAHVNDMLALVSLVGVRAIAYWLLPDYDRIHVSSRPSDQELLFWDHIRTNPFPFQNKKPTTSHVNFAFTPAQDMVYSTHTAVSAPAPT